MEDENMKYRTEVHFDDSSVKIMGFETRNEAESAAKRWQSLSPNIIKVQVLREHEDPERRLIYFRRFD